VSKAKRGYESKIPLYKIFNHILYRLHTGCQWKQLPILNHPQHPDKKEISWQAVYYPSEVEWRWESGAGVAHESANDPS
jgi:transposase